jgi:hypothetical protein
LAEAEVFKGLLKSKLPKQSIERLSKRSYTDEEALAEAITSELEYIASLTNSGSVFNMGEGQKPEEEVFSEAEVEEFCAAADERYLG